MARGNLINSQTKRNRLVPRNEPYWHEVSRGKHVGYRKGKRGGAWVAKFTVTGRGREIKRLGRDSEIASYAEALEAANRWFSGLGGGSRVGYTVGNACQAYMDHLRVEKGETAVETARVRIDAHIKISTLWGTKLSALAPEKITRWRNGQVVTDQGEDKQRASRATANRTLTVLKAALNLAYQNGNAGTDDAWKRVKLFGKDQVNAARPQFLNSDQIARLLDVTKGGFRALVISALHTGARYGVLTKIRVKDFDSVNGVIHFPKGKTAAYTCHLSDAATAHFKRLSRDKLPNTLLHLRDDGSAWMAADQRVPWKRAREAVRLPEGTVFYSLRHTAISRQLAAGIPILTVAQSCGTSVQMIQDFYGKTTEEAKAMMRQFAGALL